MSSNSVSQLKYKRMLAPGCLAALLACAPLSAQVRDNKINIPLTNWPVAPYFQLHPGATQTVNNGTYMTARRGSDTAAGSVATAPLVFIAITPCRIMDTRSGSGFTGDFGPPSLAPGVPRTVPIPFSTCGVPSAAAYSLNFTVIPQGTLGWFTAWPDNAPWPGNSILNSITGQVIANAGITPAGTDGGIDVEAPNPTDLVIDINGYFVDVSPSTLTLPFNGSSPSSVNTLSINNVATGTTTNPTKANAAVLGSGFYATGFTGTTEYAGNIGVEGIGGTGEAGSTASVIGGPGGIGVLGYGGTGGPSDGTGTGAQGGAGVYAVGGNSALAGVGNTGGPGVQAYGGNGGTGSPGVGGQGGYGLIATGGNGANNGASGIGLLAIPGAAGPGGANNDVAAVFQGNVSVTGTLTKGAGSFRIDDPIDPAHKYLSHSFVESPDMMNIYNGNVTTDAKGRATITLPNWFQALNRDFRYQLTVMGEFAQAIVASEMTDNKFTIRTNKPHVRVSWQVTGIRQDAYANAHRIPVEENKPELEQNTYLHPELQGQPQEKNVIFAHNPELLPKQQPVVAKDTQVVGAPK